MDHLNFYFYLYILLIFLLWVAFIGPKYFLSIFQKINLIEPMDTEVVNTSEYSIDVNENSYHESTAAIQKKNPDKNSQMFVKDSDGFIVPVTISDSTIQKMQPLPIFYKPGDYIYGASNKTPTYRESIILSKLGLNNLYRNSCKMGPTENGFITWDCNNNS
jgi:hypothetical protein